MRNFAYVLPESLDQAQTAKQCVGAADHWIEVRAGHGADREDDRHQGCAGRESVLEQFQAGVARAQALCGNTRTDDGD